MANPVYIGTFEEVMGPKIIGGDGWNAEPFVQVYDATVLVNLERLSHRKEYWLREDGVITWRVPDIREAVRAPRGKKIFSADYSQIEVKIVTWLSQDPFLLAAVRSGKDIHSYIACEIFSYNYDEFVYIKNTADHPLHKLYSTIRTNIKAVVFGTIYGAGAPRIAAITKMTEEEAQDFIDKFFEKACVLKAYLDHAAVEAVANKCSRSARGRIRSYEIPAMKDPNYRKIIGQVQRFAGNMPVQATSADLLKMAMPYFYLALRGKAPFFESIENNGGWAKDRVYPGAYLLLAVHDELVGECNEEDAGTNKHPGPVPQLLKLSMEYAYNELSMFIKDRDEDGHLKRTEIFIRDIPNKVDVVVNDYWSKE